ncbi:MAG TPA: heat-inducible transcriptional repressor HrcA [Solirubrobacteraceae bacterium]|jgi:heat-inducible transcriptional repressor
MLTPRQERILCSVVDAHVQSGQPISSRTIAADPDLDCGPSTVRNELALLEERGLLTHPHTSAGRVPTDLGHRYVVDRMLAAGQELGKPRPLQPLLQLSLMRKEIEEAMRSTTETLSQVTNLLAVVSAPRIDSATIRRVEVIQLQPQVLAVVIITSTGGVCKMLVTFEDPVDSGLVAWAEEYLNERLTGLGVGARMLHQRLLDDGLGEREGAFVKRLAPAFFEELPTEPGGTLYFDGASHLLAKGQIESIAEINELMDMLERRVTLLSVLRSTLSSSDVLVRIGAENELPAMRSLALVAAGYGLAQRKLGAVSVIGPVRMDYAGAIATVREAAQELSRFVQYAYADS